MKMLKREITWNAQSLNHFDLRTKQCERDVQRIIHLQQVANQLPNALSNPKKNNKITCTRGKCPYYI